MVDVDAISESWDLSPLLGGIVPEFGIWIGGKWREAVDGASFEVEDPSNLKIITTLPDGGSTEATEAVDAAAAALEGWRSQPPRNRAEVLRKAFEIMQHDAERLAQLIAWENGKPLVDARAEVTYAAEFFRWFSEEAVRADGEYGSAPAGGARSVVTHHPVGVAALVTPWNFPAAMVTRKIAPALAAGCTVVVKPPHETPLTALALAEILRSAGVPDGVVNIVPTTRPDEVVTTWLEDSRVRKISFTGSTRIGKVLLRQAADRVVNSSMELGGNAPFVVTADADLGAAVAGAMTAKFRNGGQACTAANRFYVHASVVDEFVQLLAASMSALKVGPSSDGETTIGPLVSRKAVEGVRSLVDEAVRAGARIEYQLPLPEGDGHYFSPTLLTRVRPDSPIVAQEIFGPVAPIVAWSDEADLVDWVNGSEMGLAAYVYAGDLEHAIRLGESIEAGMVGINRGIVSDPSAPFGGFKQSGLGREGAREGLREFQETQYLSVAWH